MNLLLHTCCAPCAISAVNEAKKDGFSITGFFCNSNIHPQAEYVRRKEASREYFKSEGMDLIFFPYNAGDFFRKTAESELPPGRCLICWNMRLKETATFARNNRFDAFTTTLLGSPYQDHGVIKKACEGLSRENGVVFYYRDFRAGFKDARERARKSGMYRQRYCGCAFSIIEREEANG